MSARQRALRERREALQLQAAAERAALAAELRALGASLSLVDRGMAVLRQIGARPVVLVAGAVAMATLGPARVIGWVWRGYLAFSAARSLVGPLLSLSRAARAGGREGTAPPSAA